MGTVPDDANTSTEFEAGGGTSIAVMTPEVEDLRNYAESEPGAGDVTDDSEASTKATCESPAVTWKNRRSTGSSDSCRQLGILWGTSPYTRSSEYDQRIATSRTNRSAVRNLTCSVRLGKLRDSGSTVGDLECSNGLTQAEYVGRDWVVTLDTREATRSGPSGPASRTPRSRTQDELEKLDPSPADLMTDQPSTRWRGSIRLEPSPTHQVSRSSMASLRPDGPDFISPQRPVWYHQISFLTALVLVALLLVLFAVKKPFGGIFQAVLNSAVPTRPERKRSSLDLRLENTVCWLVVALTALQIEPTKRELGALSFLILISKLQLIVEMNNLSYKQRPRPKRRTDEEINPSPAAAAIPAAAASAAMPAVNAAPLSIEQVQNQQWTDKGKQFLQSCDPSKVTEIQNVLKSLQKNPDTERIIGCLLEKSTTKKRADEGLLEGITEKDEIYNFPRTATHIMLNNMLSVIDPDMDSHQAAENARMTTPFNQFTTETGNLAPYRRQRIIKPILKGLV